MSTEAAKRDRCSRCGHLRVHRRYATLCSCCASQASQSGGVVLVDPRTKERETRRPTRAKVVTR